MLESIRLYMRVNQTTTLGPFKRYALWVQGCRKNCPNCISPDSRSEDSGEISDIIQLIDEIVKTKEIEGVTVSGGEPFLQAEELTFVLEGVRRHRDIGVIIYSGYTLEELMEMSNENPAILALLKQCDLLIDGPFEELLNDGLSLRGSSNQQIHLLSNRYADIVSSLYGIEGRKVEWRMEDGKMKLIGIPEKNMSRIFTNAFRNR